MARLGEGAGKTHGRFGKDSGKTQAERRAPAKSGTLTLPAGPCLGNPSFSSPAHAPRAAPAFRHATECVKLSGPRATGRPLSVRGVRVVMLYRPRASGRPSGDLAALFEKYSGPWPAGPRALPHRSCSRPCASGRVPLARWGMTYRQPPMRHGRAGHPVPVRAPRPRPHPVPPRSCPFPSAPHGPRAPSPPGAPHRQPPCALPKPPPSAPTFAARRLFFPLIKQAVTPHRAPWAVPEPPRAFHTPSPHRAHYFWLAPPNLIS